MRFVSRIVLMTLSLAAPGLLAVPATAQQDSLSQQFDDIRSSFGLGREHAPIDFTERPPIVVPPTYALPTPGNANADRLGVNDPDVAARRKALSDMRRPVPPTDPGAAATGRDSRAYLIDPPSGMRDPDAGRGRYHARYRRTGQRRAEARPLAQEESQHRRPIGASFCECAARRACAIDDGRPGSLAAA